METGERGEPVLPREGEQAVGAAALSAEGEQCANVKVCKFANSQSPIPSISDN